MSAHAAQAGVNVWTSNGPGPVAIAALVVDPTAPGTLYAATSDGTRGVEVVVLNAPECIRLMKDFIAAQAELWNEDIGV